MTPLRAFRIVAWSAVALVGAWLLYSYMAGGTGVVTPAAAPQRTIGGPFALTSHTGQRVTDQSLRGQPYLVFFGFTNCPDICPTTLFELSELMAELGPDADRFKVLLISVDPERDSQQLLSTYMTAFDPRILALRGTRTETDAALKAFAAYGKKVPMDGGYYTMEHTTGVYLMDSDGRYAGLMRMEDTREERLKKIRDLLASAAG